MKSFKLVLIFVCLSGIALAQDLSVKEMTCEHKKNPIGIDVTQPRLFLENYRNRK